MAPPKKFVPDGVVRSFTLQGRSLKDWLLYVQGRITSLCFYLSFVIPSELLFVKSKL